MSVAAICVSVSGSTTAKGEVRVDNPTQNLESYFLDVVSKARAANETSGAQSGATVAEYLRGGMPQGRAFGRE